MKTASKSSKTTKTPLGCILLEGREKKIFPMNDFFLTSLSRMRQTGRHCAK
jgi:hypothetical protein